MQNGVTALAYAVVRGYADIARLLLENGATMDFEDNVRRADIIYVFNYHQIRFLSCRFGKRVFMKPVNMALLKLWNLC